MVEMLARCSLKKMPKKKRQSLAVSLPTVAHIQQKSHKQSDMFNQMFVQICKKLCVWCRCLNKFADTTSTCSERATSSNFCCCSRVIEVSTSSVTIRMRSCASVSWWRRTYTTNCAIIGTATASLYTDDATLIISSVRGWEPAASPQSTSQNLRHNHNNNATKCGNSLVTKTIPDRYTSHWQSDTITITQPV